MTRLSKSKLLAPGEWLTLVGMTLAVLGASLPWTTTPPPAPIPSALYQSREPRTAVGFQLKLGSISVGWMVVAGAVGCGALTLFRPSQKERLPLLVMQSVVAVGLLGLASYHLGNYSGVYLTMAGAGLLLAGGVLRFSQPG